MKKLATLILFSMLLFCDTVLADSTMVITNARDTTYCDHLTTKHLADTSWVVTTPPVTIQTELHGYYSHPSYVTIGDPVSENVFLQYGRDKGYNMVNCYSRKSFETSSGRKLFAAFAKKSKTYGMIKMSNDFRGSDEIAGWVAFYSEYPELINFVFPLTEKEPWRSDVIPPLDYTGTFSMLRDFRAQTKRFESATNHIWLIFYEGWLGKGYSNPQAAVDTVVKYCDAIAISNYVTVANFLITKWGSNMSKRVNDGNYKNGVKEYGGITTACRNVGKTNFGILDLESLEYTFLFNYYACPKSTTKLCNSYWGSTWSEIKNLYNASPPEVISRTDLWGGIKFYIKYLKEAQP
jgi:hypothetical protein